MTGLARSATGLPAKKHSMRPPASTRPLSSRSQSQPYHGRSQSGVISPAESTLSISSGISRAKSPSVPPHGGSKRKEREFEHSEAEETNINVVVRCRGRNDREVRENSGVVLSTSGVNGKSIELSMGPNAVSNKTYHFDKVFSPAADQSMIYDDVVIPILDEMLSGFNCTIFAYGQTGTGKTYTMSGDMSDTFGLLSDSAGIIPRVLHSLFNKLEADEAESSVKCSFIELYNEELRDLLSAEDNVKLKIYEEGNKKGHNATMVQGMEESHIQNAIAGIKLLRSGSFKRQVAATKCNDLSSRSHTVFTVTVYIKRCSEDGEEYVSAGKLNLVDLAGSENIQRSGAENKRAAEAGLINKSLLTLGRVINALVEKGSHIPYRESKLTRLLQDSLGGRTKTCIIATVSPAKSNLEETISTLDYAFRAKNIRNKPQVNQMVSKKTLLKEFTAEIEKLKSELITTRQRNGVYLTSENYEEITVQSESRRILSEEQKAKIETMEVNLRNKVQELFSLTHNFQMLKKDNESVKSFLDETKGILEKTEFVLENTKQNLAEEKILRKAHEMTEEQLSVVGNELISTISKTVTDVGGLHSKLRRRSDLQSMNRSKWRATQAQVSDVTRLVEIKIDEFQTEQDQVLGNLSQKIKSFVEGELKKFEESQNFLQEKQLAFDKSEKEVSEQTLRGKNEMNEVLEEIKTLREDVKTRIGEGLKGLSVAAERISAEVICELGEFHTQLHTSYSSLGKDFKGIFEELTKHLSTQKAEATELRHQIEAASTAAMEANAASSIRLSNALEEERRKSASDREDLLAQITNLVMAKGKAQDLRLASSVGEVRKDLSSSKAAFSAAQLSYREGMSNWSKKEQFLVDEVCKSRDMLKTKLKNDWTAANEYNASIQKTTKSIQEETIRIVDAQMNDINHQMQALDDFVRRARSQNDEHHSLHRDSMSGLSSNIRQSYRGISNTFSSGHDRNQNLGTELSSIQSNLEATLLPFIANVRQPLIELRSNIIGETLKEYIPTGETPQKIQYEFPSVLPRTEAHETLVAALRSTSSSSFSSNELMTTILETKVTNPTSTNNHASTPIVFADTSCTSTTIPVISEITDCDEEVALLVLPSSSELKPTRDLGGLREIAVNVSAGAAHAVGLHDAASASNTTAAAASAVSAPQPTRAHSADSKLPMKLGSKASSNYLRVDGRENERTLSLSRRLRSTPIN
ncbi:MAG: kinesin motor protein cin8 [Trizodia sp. TS-e1964]|nr:MAG: kinesin motor protein cin8 [Trizodia sp. TS-e1964]